MLNENKSDLKAINQIYIRKIIYWWQNTTYPQRKYDLKAGLRSIYTRYINWHIAINLKY